MVEAPNDNKIFVDMAAEIRKRISGGMSKPAAIASKAFREWLICQTPLLPSSATVTQRIDLLFTGQIPNCKLCSEPVSWRKDQHAYSVYCSSKCAHNDPEFLQRQEESMLVKHGVRHFSQSQQAKQARVNTAKLKYGVTNNFWATRQPHDVSVDYHLKRNTVLGKLTKIDELISQGYTQAEIGQTVGVSQPRISSLLTHTGRSTVHETKTSSAQRQIIEFIRALGVETTSNVRLIPPYEVDIFIPSHNIAIEVNGIFWHSELAGKHKKYHLKKTEQCEQQGIRLLHIYDVEWKYKQQIVMSRLTSILGKASSKIYARNCTVGMITTEQAREFFEENHMQGHAPCSIAVGLFYEGYLISAMSFGRPRFNKEYQYEMMRFATKLRYTVVGGASKLFSFFTKCEDPTSIISYADKRWNIGEVYRQIGFIYDGATGPNYRYFRRQGDTSKLLSRNMFQKHKLSTILLEFDPALSEWENMVKNGYDRIWDCGNTRWVWTRQ